MKQDEGIVKTDQGLIDSAKVNLVYCHITAPITGRVGLRLVDPGNIVHATDTNGLLVITQIDRSASSSPLGGSASSRAQKDARRPEAAGGCVDRDMKTKKLSYRNAHDGRQRDRPDHRDGAAARHFRQQAQCSSFRTSSSMRACCRRKSAAWCWCRPRRSSAIPTTRTCTWSKPDSTVTVRQVKLGTSEGDEYRNHLGPGAGDVVVMTGRRQVAGRHQGERAGSRLAAGGGPERQAGKAESEVSPSRTFILRPVATSLLMVGILLAGAVAYQAAAGFGAAGSGLSDHSGGHVLSGRQSGRDGVVGHGAAGAAVRPGAGPAADDLDQLRWQLGHHAAIQPQPEYRRRRAGSAAVHQRVGHVSCRRIFPRRRSTARPIRPIRRF